MILLIKFSRLWFQLDLEMGFQELLMTRWLGVKKMYYSLTFIGNFSLHQSVTCQLENAPLHLIPALSQPFEHLLVDFVSSLSNSKAGSMYFFTVIPLVNSSIFTDMLITHRIKHTQSTAYPPESLGAIKRFHQTLKSLSVLSWVVTGRKGCYG